MMTARHIFTRFSKGASATVADLRNSHVHEWREILYIVEGTSRYIFNNQMFDAVPGCVFLIDSWVSHLNGYQEDDHDLFHLWIHCTSQDNITISPIRVTAHGEYSLRSPSIKLPVEYGMVIENRWNLVGQMDRPDQAVFERLMREPLNAMLDEVSFQTSKNGSETSATSPTVDAVIENVRKYIRTSNARGCTLEKLEKLSGYNRFYLAHRFKQCTGSTIGAFINEVRREYTEAALQRGMRQKEIAAELGFSSPSNFWNWLQKHKD